MDLTVVDQLLNTIDELGLDPRDLRPLIEQAAAEHLDWLLYDVPLEVALLFMYQGMDIEWARSALLEGLQRHGLVDS